MVAIALPASSLSVLFDEIRQDLGLTIVQIGVIWSVSSFTGLLMAIPGGLLSDRFGPRTMLGIIYIVGGFFGLLRGFTTSYIPFLLTSFVFGILLATAGLNMIKVVTSWFSPAERGMATGIFSSGFAGGFLIGSFSAATYLSPWLGGWPNVFFLFGGLSILIGIAWLLLHPKPTKEETTSRQGQTLRESTIDPLKQVLFKRNLWVIGVAKLGFLGCVRGFTGYLPLYLRGEGWVPAQADSTISMFYLFSLIFVVPLSIYSDRVGRRRPFLIILMAFMGIAVLGVPLTDGLFLTACVILAGVTFDGVMGLTVTAVTEVKGIGAALASTAVGFTFMIQQLGGTFAPILGNSLEQYSPQTPFYFWGGIAVVGAIIISLLREEKRV